MKLLNELQAGDTGIVLCNACESHNACRLAELGLTEGEEIQVLQSGCPMLLQVGESRMCLRTEAAAQVGILPTY